jgi:uncharacterized membrane protein YhaH (DUF805 family)
MDFRYLYTSFDGRINRKPFWLASLAMIVAAVLVSFVVIVPITMASPVMGALASLVLYLAALYPGVALGVKRLHDRGKTGRLMAVFIAPGLITQIGGLLGLTGSYQLLAGQSIYMPNAFGWILNLASFAIGIWALVELGFLRGTTGANEYGPDPLTGDTRQEVAG